MIFQEAADYQRFQMLLYVCNSTIPIHLSEIAKRPQGLALGEVISEIRGEQFVDIGAYALMPNHHHLLLRERVEGGTTAFMQKLGTAYTMYFNKKYERTGSLFSGKFKAKHVATDEYFARIVNYIHGNPAELHEPGWKNGLIRDERRLKQFLSSYRFSSLPDHDTEDERVEGHLINKNSVLELIGYTPTFETLMEDAYTFQRDVDFD